MDDFRYDVFLSHSAKDKAVVRDMAERLRKDGVKVWFDEWELKPGDSIPAKIEEGLEHSRVLVLCMSAHAFGSDWAQLESGTFRFRDPLNKQRRFLPLRLDDAPIKGSLAQFLYINWHPAVRVEEYAKLLEACLHLAKLKSQAGRTLEQGAETTVELGYGSDNQVNAFAFSKDGKRALVGADENVVRFWDLEEGRCLKVLEGHADRIESVVLADDQQRAISGSRDGTIRLWDVETESWLHKFEGHNGGVSAVGWTADQKVLLSGSWKEGMLRGWESDFGSLCSERHCRSGILCVALSVERNQNEVLIGLVNGSLELWGIRWGWCRREFHGHTGPVLAVAWNASHRALSGSDDATLRLWDTRIGSCERVLEGHTGAVRSVAWSPNQRQALSGSDDSTMRLWDVETGRCLRVFEGHNDPIKTVAWRADGLRGFSGDRRGNIRIWNLSEFAADMRTRGILMPTLASFPDQVQYTNAKVLVVGDTHSGKTGLTHRLATGEWKPSEDSTIGAWSTQWRLKHVDRGQGVDREIWLWDFGGQADQRLVHQLFMDRAALILLLFNADQDDVLPGVWDWLTALRRCVETQTQHFLVAGRIDSGFKASRGKLQAFAKEQGLAYHETSAKSGDGCDELRAAIIAGIPWTQMEKRTSPRIFKLIKDEILRLRDEGQVLHTYKELRELLWRRLPDEPHFTDETLETVIGLLDGPGVVKELDYGTYILLAPEWINAYAQAVIRTLRSAENDLGVLPLRSIAEGKLIYQSIGRDGAPVEMKRLPPADERVVLGEMERQLEQRGLCLRQGDKLVFPSHCGRDRTTVEKLPSVFVSYTIKGYLDDIYATLVVKLADSQSFKVTVLWRDAADFVTLRGDYHMGIKLTRESSSEGNIGVYFGSGVSEGEQVIFANYIHAHLEEGCEEVQRLRYWVCPKCLTPKGNPEVLMENLLAEGEDATAECDRYKCRTRFPLWDALEKKFASEAVRARVEQLQADDEVKLTTRRKGKLLVLDVGARITSANQKWMEIPGDEDDGIDLLVEFTDDDGNGIGNKGLCLQLKAGNSHLTKRKDGTEIFTIKKQRWVETWMNQKFPVMLVVGTFSEDDDRAVGKDKLEFADVRWMEITSVLKRESQNGTKPVKQIEFKGERLDLSSVQRWRRKLLALS